MLNITNRVFTVFLSLAILYWQSNNRTIKKELIYLKQRVNTLVYLHKPYKRCHTFLKKKVQTITMYLKKYRRPVWHKFCDGTKQECHLKTSVILALYLFEIRNWIFFEDFYAQNFNNINFLQIWSFYLCFNDNFEVD